MSMTQFLAQLPYNLLIACIIVLPFPLAIPAVRFAMWYAAQHSPWIKEAFQDRETSELTILVATGTVWAVWLFTLCRPEKKEAAAE